MKKQTREERDLELLISRNVIKDLPDDILIKAQKFVQGLLEHRRLGKLHDTYINGVKNSLSNTNNNKIYVSYNLDGAVTGRLSNSGMRVKKGKVKEGQIGISFHTLPREQQDYNIRNYVVAPDDWLFVTADVKAMELRILAHVSQEANMIRAFESGEDLHRFSAAMTFGVPLEEVTTEQRQIAKEVSFLTVYGGKAYTLALKRNISEDKAQRIIDKWMKAYPGVKIYMDYCRSFIENNSYISTIFGRRRNLKNINSPFFNVRESAFRQGLNFTIQSAASDFLLCMILDINNALEDKGMRSRIVASVHDSIELVSPKDEVDYLTKLVYNKMVNCNYARKNFGIDLLVPMEVDIEVGTSFGNGKRIEMA